MNPHSWTVGGEPMEKRETRKDREFKRHRSEVLEAAERVFAEKGYYKATMEDVAQEAEFAVGTLYKFFRGKDDLYKAILEQRADIFDARCREALERGATTREKLEGYISARLAMFDEYPAFFSIYFQETLENSCRMGASLTPEVVKKYTDFKKLLTQTLQEGIGNNELRKEDPVLLTSLLEGMLHGYLADAVGGVHSRAREKDKNSIFQLFLRGIIR
jgi:AcrR family transcriptional regulator